MTSTRKLMGLDNVGDRKIPISVRDWNAVKLAIWRSKVGLQVSALKAEAIIARCRHVEGCPGKVFEHEPCFGDCPDREHRMDALVILNNYRTYAPQNARKVANEPFFAPTRELYSELIAELLSTQAELEALKTISIQVVAPPENEEPVELPVEPKALTAAEIDALDLDTGPEDDQQEEP